MSQEIRFDKDTTEKLDTLIECFQLVLELVHVKHNTDLHMMRREIKKELLEEMKEKDWMKKNEHLLIRLSTQDKQRLQSLGQIQDKSVSMIVRESYRDTLNRYSTPPSNKN